MSLARTHFPWEIASIREMESPSRIGGLHHQVGVGPELVEDVAVDVPEHEDPLVAAADLLEGLDVAVAEARTARP